MKERGRVTVSPRTPRYPKIDNAVNMSTVVNMDLNYSIKTRS